MARDLKPAVAYLRTSSATNVGADKDSDRRQRAAIEAFAKRAGFSIMGEYYDKAVSGADRIDHRPGFRQMLQHLAANGAKTIIVESPDRFARDLAVQLAGHDMLKDLGIADAVNAKAKLGRGIPNAEFVVKGESDIAIQQIPELMMTSGIDIVGPFPPALQSLTEFAAAVLATSANPAAAKALVEFLDSPETLALLKSRGFDVKP